MLIGLCGAILAPTPGVASLRLAIRVTAATSLLCFLMAFVAQAAWLLWPGRLTAWWRRHRRQWGLLFVASHTLHLVWVCWLREMAPALWHSLVPITTLLTGGVAYAWLWTLGLTSTDRAVEVMGRARWQWLHRWGSYYLWLSFLVAYGKRVPIGLAYLFPVGLLLSALFLRWRARRNPSST